MMMSRNVRRNAIWADHNTIARKGCAFEAAAKLEGFWNTPDVCHRGHPFAFSAPNGTRAMGKLA